MNNENNIVYYKYKNKLIKHDQEYDIFYILDEEDHKWYINPSIFDAFYEYSNEFERLTDEEETKLKR